jgi:hypothetical protein
VVHCSWFLPRESSLVLRRHPGTGCTGFQHSMLMPSRTPSLASGSTSDIFLPVLNLRHQDVVWWCVC